MGPRIIIMEYMGDKKCDVGGENTVTLNFAYIEFLKNLSRATSTLRSRRRDSQSEEAKISVSDTSES